MDKLSRRRTSRAVAAVAVAAGRCFIALNGASARGWGDDWRWQHHHYYRPYYPPQAYYVVPAPRAYYAPPPVYYAPPPPPVYYAPAPRYYAPPPSLGLYFRF